MLNLVWILLIVLILIAIIIAILLFVAVLMLAKLSKKMDKMAEAMKAAPKDELTKIQAESAINRAKIERTAKPEARTEVTQPGGMIICPKCYNGVDMNSKVCPFCQAPLK